MQLNSWDLLNDLKRTYSFHANRRWDTGHIDRIKNGSDVHKSTPFNFTLLRNINIFLYTYNIFYCRLTRGRWRTRARWRSPSSWVRASRAPAWAWRGSCGTRLTQVLGRWWRPQQLARVQTLPYIAYTYTATAYNHQQYYSGAILRDRIVALVKQWYHIVPYLILHFCTIPRTTVNCTMLYLHLHIFVYANTRS